MVDIIADVAKLDDKPDEYFRNFDVVVVTEAAQKLQIRIDNACRLMGVKFFAGDVWGTFDTVLPICKSTILLSESLISFPKCVSY